MKSLILVIPAILAPLAASAAPVLNDSGPAMSMTAFPDSVDPNLYYLAPTELSVAHDDAGVPEFSFLEQSGFFSDSALVQTTMAPSYSAEDLTEAENSITKADPKARFAPLPFSSSSVIFDVSLGKFVKTSDCNHPAGVVGQAESCSFQLTSDGAKVMLSSFKTGLTLTLQFQYTVDGVIEKTDRSYVAQTNTYAVAGLLGGAELAKYPQLFLDSDGHEIGVGGN